MMSDNQSNKQQPAETGPDDKPTAKQPNKEPGDPVRKWTFIILAAVGLSSGSVSAGCSLLL